jgi:hypothetical protein
VPNVLCRPTSIPHTHRAVLPQAPMVPRLRNLMGTEFLMAKRQLLVWKHMKEVQ